jgi:hypothetical protein
MLLLKLNNLKYWRETKEPVVVVRIIDVAGVEPVLYWKIVNTSSIDKLIKKAEQNESKRATINFLEEDRLTEDERDIFRSLPALKNVDILEESSAQLRDKYLEYLSPFFNNNLQEYSFDNTGCEDHFVEDYNTFCYELDNIKSCDYFDEIVVNFPDRLTAYNELDEIFDKYRELVIIYIRVLRNNSVLDILQNWKEHPYHSDLAYIVNNIKRI